jgi:hypothetical protein
LHNLTNNDSLISCKDYLDQTNNFKLTIIDRIDIPNRLLASFGRNFYYKSQFGSTPITVKKGYVPIMKRDRDTIVYISDISNSLYPDYFCSNKNASLNKTSQIFNLTQINLINTGKSYKNVAINFIYNDSNQIILSNYSLNRTYNIFGSFSTSVYTLFGGNYLNSQRFYVYVQQAKEYPFRDIQIERFELNCTLNGLILNCFLRVNISSYANSFQQITIDYGDGLNFDSFQINPYCKYTNKII